MSRVDKRPALSNTAPIAKRPLHTDPRAITEMDRNWYRREQTPEQSAANPLRGVGIGRTDAGCEQPRGIKEELS